MRQLFAAAALAAAVAVSGPAVAQDNWPTKPVRVVVPFAAGGTTDLFARILTNYMPATFGQPFVVENRAGAGGNLGADMVAKAPGDGYTLLVGTVSTHAINPFIYPNIPFDATRDFQPVSLIAQLPNMLVVNPKIPANSVADLVAHLKANPDKLNFGSSGAGTSTHLAAELFKMMTGTKMTHVPFRSSAEVMQNLSGGHIDLAFDNMTLAWPQAQAGTVRALGVTSPARSGTAPNVPTIAEGLPGFEATSWHGLFAPASTPRPIVEKLAAEVRRILSLPEVQTRMRDIGAVPSPMSPEQFREFIAGEQKKWQEVVKVSGAKVDG
jgi:tripartite-type tricarboxylate transporter receptor subunit TctC